MLQCFVRPSVCLSSVCLSHRVFYNHNLKTKVAVYNAMCVSVLLFGCETWTLYCRHFKALEAYHAKSLQKIPGLHWWHKVPHTEMRCRANTHSMEQSCSASLDGLVMAFG